MTTQELRETFLNFFAERGHLVRPSAPLVLHDDPTSFFTSAGMQPYMAAFRGLEEPPAPRVTSIQKCTRTGDLEGVGVFNRYHTFFEMLGNFSFGDYFKEGAIDFAWEFFHDVLQLPTESLWFTVFTTDDEAEELWHKRIGIPRERILRFGREDNWWPKLQWEGPCGPCTEIHVDLGPEFGCEGGCAMGCPHCDRFLEVWNLVFQQYTEAPDGGLTPLPAPGIDTGMGLERLALVVQNKRYTMETTELARIMDACLAAIATTSSPSGTGVSPVSGPVSGGTGVSPVGPAATQGKNLSPVYAYGSDPTLDIAARVITDHLRASTFLMADGVAPSNEGPGYVLRRFIRRAYRFGRNLGATGPFLYQALPAVVENMGAVYPELGARADYAVNLLRREEERFADTLDQGLALLEEMVEHLSVRREDTLSGELAFKLYDTYGFPLDVTRELAAEKGLKVDEDGFEAAMQEQRRRSRGKVIGLQAHTRAAELPPSEFVGYYHETAESAVTALLVGGEPVAQVAAGEQVAVALDRTPFYAEKGGQVADHGVLTTDSAQVVVTEVTVEGASFLHHGRVTAGTLRVGETVTATVDHERRSAIRRHHTAVHLLQAALREALGEHVAQAGSWVGPDRARFDFTHHEQVSEAVLSQVERRVNEWIVANYEVTCDVKTLADAKAEGAMALFGETYGEEVRVVRAGEVSAELCGGTHVSRTGDIGVMRLLSETSVAAGVRRIEIVTGLAALDEWRGETAVLREVGHELKCSREEIVERVGGLRRQIRDLEKRVQEARRASASVNLEEILGGVETVGATPLISRHLPDTDKETLGALADQVAAAAGESVVLLAGTENDSAFFVCKVPDALVKQGVKAGDLIREACKAAGGGGGGKPQFAQGGGQADLVAVGLQAAKRFLAG
ncbi:MAG TPA: alanine--tRNA ligase [Armatimonadota bacterium]|jgi:alanyl-tRNA synthetase